MIGSDQDETIYIVPPEAISVLVYWSESRARWISKVLLTAVSLDTQSTEVFSQESDSPTKPSRQEVADQVVEMFAHEVAEQLGLNPHEEAT